MQILQFLWKQNKEKKCIKLLKRIGKMNGYLVPDNFAFQKLGNIEDDWDEGDRNQVAQQASSKHGVICNPTAAMVGPVQAISCTDPPLWGTALNTFFNRFVWKEDQYKGSVVLNWPLIVLYSVRSTSWLNWIWAVLRLNR